MELTLPGLQGLSTTHPMQRATGFRTIARGKTARIITNLPRLQTMRKEIKAKELRPVALSAHPSDIGIVDNSSPSATVLLFYSSINAKKPKRLDTFISDDCFFEDFSFPTPFRGKKEVLSFLEQLVTGMGYHSEFIIEQICQGNDCTIGVNWHLVWKKHRVPFTRGFSYFEFSREGERLLIRKAQIITESPIKPGSFVLSLFKIVTSIFDAFPEAAEWFLKSPQIVLKPFVKTYKMILEPFISPMIAWYTKIWSLMACFLSFAFRLLQHILTILPKSTT